MIADALKKAAKIADDRGARLIVIPVGIKIEASDVTDGKVRRFTRVVLWDVMEGAVDPVLVLDRAIEVTVKELEVC